MNLGSRSSYGLGLAAILAVAILWDLIVARRGHFALDQSLVLDGAWRLYSGQVPYRDFLLPFGVSTCLLQWFGFEIFGPTYDSYLYVGAIQNMLGTLLTLLIVRRLLPDHRWVHLAAALLAAFWFQAIFGTPWVDQTAFLGCMLALLMVLRPGRPEEGVGAWREIAAGLCLVLTGLGKQNAAALLTFCLVVFLLVRSESWRDGVRSIGNLMLGVLIGWGLWFLWLLLYADPSQFLDAYLRYPSGNLIPRLLNDPARALSGPWIGSGNGLPRLLSLSVAGLAVFHWIRSKSSIPAGIPPARMRSLVWLTLLLVFFQNVFLTVTYNHAENCYPFAGVLLGMLMFFLQGLRSSNARPESFVGKALPWLPILLLLLLIGRGTKVAWTRDAHDIFRSSVFTGEIDRPGWRSLQWARPHQVTPRSDIQIEDLNALIQDLEKRDDNFFVWPDSTFLYPLLRKPSPQPILFFWRGITSPRDPDGDLDQRIVTDLEKNQVRVVVQELDWFGKGGEIRSLGDLPLLRSWIAENFEEVATYGIYQVLAWKGD